jgi:hypothetical protein
MVVEVILGEIREPRDVEDQAVDAMLTQCMTRDLHRDSSDALFAHLGEKFVQVG